MITRREGIKLFGVATASALLPHFEFHGPSRVLHHLGQALFVAAAISMKLKVTDQNKPYVAVIYSDKNQDFRKEIVGSYVDASILSGK